jgi:calcium-dependent protein kinase
MFEEEKNFFLVTEYFEGMDLVDKLFETKKHLGEKMIAHIIKEVLLALQVCHKNKICHRDLKAENILINSSG